MGVQRGRADPLGPPVQPGNRKDSGWAWPHTPVPLRPRFFESCGNFSYLPHLGATGFDWDLKTLTARERLPEDRSEQSFGRITANDNAAIESDRFAA